MSLSEFQQEITGQLTTRMELQSLADGMTMQP